MCPRQRRQPDGKLRLFKIISGSLPSNSCQFQSKPTQRATRTAAMSAIYISEPPTNGYSTHSRPFDSGIFQTHSYWVSRATCHPRSKVVLTTTLGAIDIELWGKEAPRAVRNFIQLCLEDYYENTIFHRIIKVLQCTHRKIRTQAAFPFSQIDSPIPSQIDPPALSCSIGIHDARRRSHRIRRRYAFYLFSRL